MSFFSLREDMNCSLTIHTPELLVAVNTAVGGFSTTATRDGFDLQYTDVARSSSDGALSSPCTAISHDKDTCVNDRTSGRAGAGPNIDRQLASLRAECEAAGGLVRVTVDGTSDLVGLVIEPKALRLGSEDLTTALLTAFSAARSEVRKQVADALEPGAVHPGELRSAIDELQFDAERRLDAFTQTVEALTAGLVRRA